MNTLTVPRITARIDIESQAMLKEAAHISGISSINSFVLNATLKEAKRLIEQDRIIQLNEAESLRLMQALDTTPAEPNHKLRELFTTNFDNVEIHER